MYLDYWQLDAKPFEPGYDPRTWYQGPAHQAALHKLRYAIENRRGAALLSGAAGVGKTLLVETLRRQLPSDYQPLVRLVFPQMTERDLLGYLADHCGAPSAEPRRYTVDESLQRLERLLEENCRSGRHAVVVVDEAHLLEDTGLLESLRMLLNLGPVEEPALTLVLVGQPAAGPMVRRNGPLDERIDIKVVMPPFSADETAAYIAHRMAAAGSTREIFTPDGLAAVHQLTGGVARRINRLCDLALLVGFANSQPAIDAEAIQAIHGELLTVASAA